MIDDQVPVILFTRPRRFGKTLALDMLKTFFEKTKEDTSIYFKDKQIWACGEKYQKMQGAFPVISITFKDAKFSDWDSTYAAIKNVIRDEFMRHKELFTSDSLNPVEQDYLSRMQSDELSDVEYTRALLNLGRMLEKHHQSKVVMGFQITDDGKHYKITYQGDPRYMVTIGKTPSDNRAGSNNAGMINKIML